MAFGDSYAENNDAVRAVVATRNVRASHKTGAAAGSCFSDVNLMR